MARTLGFNQILVARGTKSKINAAAESGAGGLGIYELVYSTDTHELGVVEKVGSSYKIQWSGDFKSDGSIPMVGNLNLNSNDLNKIASLFFDIKNKDDLDGQIITSSTGTGNTKKIKLNIQNFDEVHIQNDLRVGGNLYVEGENFKVDSGTLSTSDDLIELRTGANSALVGATSGIAINKYDGTNTAGIVMASDGEVRVGKIELGVDGKVDKYSDAQPLLTRNEKTAMSNSNNSTVLFWDSANKRAITKTKGTSGQFLRYDDTWAIPPDTKNTVGNTNKTSTKLFLAGTEAQSGTSYVSYTNDKVYIGTDNKLYSNGSAVLTAHQSISHLLPKAGGTMTGAIDFKINNDSDFITFTNSSNAVTSKLTKIEDGLKIDLLKDQSTISIVPKAINLTGNMKITGLGTPTAGSDAATKKYVDDKQVALGSDVLFFDATNQKYTPYSVGNKAAGRIYSGATNPTNSTRLNYDGYLYAKKLYSEGYEVATQTWADAKFLPLAGGTMTGDIDMNHKNINNILRMASNVLNGQRTEINLSPTNISLSIFDNVGGGNIKELRFTEDGFNMYGLPILGTTIDGGVIS